MVSPGDGVSGIADQGRRRLRGKAKSKGSGRIGLVGVSADDLEVDIVTERHQRIVGAEADMRAAEIWSHAGQLGDVRSSGIDVPARKDQMIECCHACRSSTSRHRLQFRFGLVDPDRVH